MSSLSELRKEATALGLKVDSKARAPYLQALRQFYLKRDFPGGQPYEELEPMLCYDFYSLPVKTQDALWKDNDWCVQEKLNGVRLILHFIRGVGIFVHSRTVSVHNYRRSELTAHLLFSNAIPDFTATVDAEVVAKGATLETTTALLHMTPDASKRLQREQNCPLIAHVFDIVTWGEMDLKPKKLCERLPYLTDFQAAISRHDLSEHFAFPPVQLQKKWEFFEKVTKNGGEGVVLKNLNAPYDASSTRRRFGFIKVKKTLELDAYVSGFERGKTGGGYERKVGALVFSVMTEEGPLAIAKVVNLPWDLRKEISQYDKATNVVKLDVNVYGRVAHLSGLELSRNARRLVHPESFTGGQT